MVSRGEYLVRKSAAITLDELLESEDHQLAVAKAAELIGESARRVSEPFRAAHPEIAWPQIIGMRNILVHEYDRVDWPIVWHTITKSIPVMVACIRPLLPNVSEDDPL
jgi:uncharacterized protein with HEPN domain